MALTACLPNSGRLDVERPSGLNAPESGIVRSVVDGDTVTVDDGSGESLQLRLAGVNAPEDDECHHDASHDHLQRLIADREITFEVLATDQFGRYLAHVWVDGLHVNVDLVASGHAFATTPGESDSYGEALLDAEDAAASSDLGIWADDACGHSDPLLAVRIEEVREDPPGRDEDDLGGEQVTLVNRGDDEVDLGGWMLRDESSRHRYTFPSGTVLRESETITVTSADPGWSPGGSPVWNNGGDLVVVLDPFGRIADHLRY